MVKNFRVVVTREQTSGPKWEMVMKMKFCPKAEVSEKEAKCLMMSGWRLTKATNSNNSPVSKTAAPKTATDHKFILSIIGYGLVALSARIRS